MANKIDILTNRQISELEIYRKKWISIGLSTEPTDIPAAKAAIQKCYNLSGLTAPQLIVCADSPLSAINILTERKKEFSNDVPENGTYNVVWGTVWNRVGIKAFKSVCNKIGDQVIDNVWDEVMDEVLDQVDPVRDKIWNQLVDRISPEIRVRLASVFLHFFVGYGCHDAGWLSHYDYFREVCGLVKETEKLTGLIALAKCCGWWIPCKDFAIIQHRPCFLNFDDNNRLHCENGVALKYPDGFNIWAIHGVSVDEQIVMKPNEQTVSQIREEGNSERKRIRIERFGWDRYLTKINAKVIDRRHNDIENTEETLVRTPDGMTILLPTCKTGRLFSLEVPYDISTCEQAQNWLHGGSQLDTIIGDTRVIGRS